ncbi:(R)-specific enoyl-CoA hydratase RipB/Ich [Pseudonocardia xishanensis]|uniref:(R)-specific enoyl-CoA hydratase RipB/Ich n=1 Tax=Pseudonocardia xishanensis TaxID=630995 RepID=A0ABP8RTM9_9PSEU
MSEPTDGLLSDGGYFEDFPVGRRMRHARAATIDEVEGGFLAKQVVNTAQAHFNEHLLQGTELGSGRLVFGLATASMVYGLVATDTAEHLVSELGWDKLRFRAPMHHGDTVEAFTEVLGVSDDIDHPNAGVVRFKHWGRRQDAVVVFEGERTALIERREPRSTS